MAKSTLYCKVQYMTLHQTTL